METENSQERPKLTGAEARRRLYSGKRLSSNTKPADQPWDYSVPPAHQRNVRPVVNSPIVMVAIIGMVLIYQLWLHYLSYKYYAYRAKNNFESILVENLKDPESYRRVSIAALPQRDSEDSITVYLKYRAKNGFGGYGFGEAEGKCNYSGQVCEFISVD